MLTKLHRLFRLKPTIDFNELVHRGAVVMDVRSRAEYACGHIRGAVNYPLDQLADSRDIINKDEIIITCCASGIRSASAVRILRSKGYSQVYNGGGWKYLQKKINKIT